MSKCIICGNLHTEELKANFAPFLTERMFENKAQQTSLLYCPVCNFYFSKYRPTDEELARLYKDYRGEEYQKQREKFEPFYTKEFNKSLGFSEEGILSRKYSMMQIMKHFLLPENIKTVLDWGGDAGQYIPDEFVNARKYVFDISGIKVLDNISLITNPEELKKYDWDLILCDHVLEHVPNPQKTVNEILSVMKEGSYLYLELPTEKYAEEYRLYGNKEYPTHIHEHINIFNLQTLENLFIRPDITILENTINIQGNMSCLIKKQRAGEEILILDNLRRKVDNLNFNLDKLTKIENQNSLLEQKINLLESLISNAKTVKRISFLQWVFSITNEGKHKVLRLFGIKLKLKRKML